MKTRMIHTLGRHAVLCLAFFLSAEAWSMDYVFKLAKGLELSWQTDDKVGVTTGTVSYGSMEQLTFWASSTQSNSRMDRNLYAVGYQLRQGTTYYSYFPYKWDANFDATKISCAYNQQTQNGNNNPSAIALCDYQMATSVAGATDCTFDYNHIGGVLRISFLAPSAMNIAKLSIKSQMPNIATIALMDIVNQDVTLSGFESALTLVTNNLDVVKGQQVVLYAASPAQDLSSLTLDVSVTDNNGAEHKLASIVGPNVKSGKLYDIALTQTSAMAKAAKLKSSQFPQITAAGIANPVAHTTDIPIDNTYTVQYVENKLKGDVNEDGDVDVLDAITLIGHYTKGRTSELSPAVCDMNDDGDIDVLDAIEIVGIYTKAQK